ncbi:PREDICTED: uncharacterized protein LOC101311758 [Fragaria vesca subsp. vesca]
MTSFESPSTSTLDKPHSLAQMMLFQSEKASATEIVVIPKLEEPATSGLPLGVQITNPPAAEFLQTEPSKLILTLSRGGGDHLIISEFVPGSASSSFWKNSASECSLIICELFWVWFGLLNLKLSADHHKEFTGQQYLYKDKVNAFLNQLLTFSLKVKLTNFSTLFEVFVQFCFEFCGLVYKFGYSYAIL